MKVKSLYKNISTKLQILGGPECERQQAIGERQKKLAEERGYEIIDHSMVLYVKPIKD